MNIEKLKIIEEYFFETYPDGFENASLAKIVKRHNVARFTLLAQEAFSKERFTSANQIVDDMVKIISRSSLISLFEKPKFRDAIKTMSLERKDMLSISLFEMLHGELESGFEIMVDVLLEDKLAKWSIMSVLPYYYSPDKEFFIKPTTTKNIIKYFEIEDIIYKPTPSFEFYKRYGEIIDKMKSYVDKRLGDDNAKFTGFLMMGMEAMIE